MKIEKMNAVSIDYTLTNKEGKQLDTSIGKEPLEYIQGVGALIPGLENELLGKEVGFKGAVVIAPKDAYGQRNESLIQDIPKDQFGEQEIVVGQQFQVMTGQGAQIITVLEVKENEISVDGNHPMAGIELHFDVEVMNVREATEEELKQFKESDGCSPSDCSSCGGGCH